MLAHSKKSYINLSLPVGTSHCTTGDNHAHLGLDYSNEQRKLWTEELKHWHPTVTCLKEKDIRPWLDTHAATLHTKGP